MSKTCERLREELIDLASELREAENNGDQDWIIEDMALVERRLEYHGCGGE